MPKSYIEVIKQNNLSPATTSATASAVEDYLYLRELNTECETKDDKEAWELLWKEFCVADNKATLALSVICRVSE